VTLRGYEWLTYSLHTFDDTVLTESMRLSLEFKVSQIHTFSHLFFCYTMNLYFGPAALHYIINNILSYLILYI